MWNFQKNQLPRLKCDCWTVQIGKSKTIVLIIL